MNITPEIKKYVGLWSACPLDDGGATDYQIILLLSGNGVTAEFNWYLCDISDIVWSVTDEVLTIAHNRVSSGNHIFNEVYVFMGNVELECISGRKETFDCIQSYNGNRLYRKIKSEATDEEIERKLKDYISFLREEILLQQEETKCL